MIYARDGYGANLFLRGRPIGLRREQMMAFLLDVEEGGFGSGEGEKDEWTVPLDFLPWGGVI